MFIINSMIQSKVFTLRTDLLGYWALNTTTDSISSLSPSGGGTGTTVTSGGPPYSSGASLFNGTSNYLYYNTPNNFKNLQSFSVSCWVYLNTVSGARTFFEIWGSPNSTYNGFLFRMNGSTIQVVIGTGNSFLVLDSASTLSTGTWTNVVFTHDLQKTILYVNGAKNAEMNSTQKVAWDNVLTVIAANFVSGYVDYYSGWMAHLGYWGRVLTPSEISYLYTKASSLRYYPFY